MKELILHEYFEKITKSHPNDLAVISGNSKVTFSELNRYANRLARVISDYKDIDYENKVIPYHIERSVNSIIAIIGILKTGSGYIPLDSQIPANRISTIIKESGAKIIITDKRVFESTEVIVLNINDIIHDGTIFDTNLNLNIAPNNPAYTIFTSGSTGVPKGVMISNRAITSYTLSVIEKLQLPNFAQYAHISTLNADLGNTMLFPSLLTGSTLHLLSKDLFLDANSFAKYIKDNRIDCLKITPNHFKALLCNENPPDTIPRLKLIFGGEGLPWDLVQKIKALSSTVKIYNHYGPTESTVGVLAWEVNDFSLEEQTDYVPLGFPLSDMKTYIINENEIVMDGELGELMVSGITLADGYINRTDLTDENFIDNPFESEFPYKKMYKTGDLVKKLPDGNIEFLGRIDFQVKIRGNRVEVNEIINVVEKYNTILKAIVLAKENQLHCFYISSEMELNTSLLIGYMKENIPDYMIPSYFKQIKEIPLNDNGKLDTSKLYNLVQIGDENQKYNEVNINESEDFSDTELKIMKIWKIVLKVSKITPDDTFYNLGGDSLTAISIIAKMNRMNLPKDFLQGMLQGLSIRDLAQRIEQGSSRDESYRHTIRTKIVKNSLNLNAVRGIFVLLVICAHYSHYVLEKLPEQLTIILNPILSFLFNMGTPGFTIIYGFTIGYSLFEVYLKDKARFKAIMRNTQLLLGIGVVLLALLVSFEGIMEWGSINGTQVARNFYSVLVFYFVASLTFPLWLKIFIKSKEVTMPVLLTSCFLYISYIFIWDKLVYVKTAGIFEILRLAFCEKYSYFNLMSGALIGFIFGIHLKQNNLRTKNYISLGIIFIIVGLSICFHSENFNLLIVWPLKFTYIWGWLLSLGVVLIIYRILERSFDIYNQSGNLFRGCLQFLYITGLLSFPLFIGHQAILPIEHVLVMKGVNESLAIFILLTIFVIIFYFFYRRLYEMNFTWNPRY